MSSVYTKEYGSVKIDNEKLHTIVFKQKYIDVPKLYFNILPILEGTDFQVSIKLLNKEKAKVLIRIKSQDALHLHWTSEGPIHGQDEVRGLDVNYFI
jgi:hypothetical protein